jgi:hypothetical protein
VERVAGNELNVATTQRCLRREHSRNEALRRVARRRSTAIAEAGLHAARLQAENAALRAELASTGAGRPAGEGGSGSDAPAALHSAATAAAEEGGGGVAGGGGASAGGGTAGVTVVFASRARGHVLGRAGANIAGIRERTGAGATVRGVPGNSDLQFAFVTGTPAQVADAAAAIRAAAEERDGWAQPSTLVRGMSGGRAHGRQRGAGGEGGRNAARRGGVRRPRPATAAGSDSRRTRQRTR